MCMGHRALPNWGIWPVRNGSTMHRAKHTAADTIRRMVRFEVFVCIGISPFQMICRLEREPRLGARLCASGTFFRLGRGITQLIQQRTQQLFGTALTVDDHNLHGYTFFVHITLINELLCRHASLRFHLQYIQCFLEHLWCLRQYLD